MVNDPVHFTSVINITNVAVVTKNPNVDVWPFPLTRHSVSFHSSCRRAFYWYFPSFALRWNRHHGTSESGVGFISFHSDCLIHNADRSWESLQKWSALYIVCDISPLARVGYLWCCVIVYGVDNHHVSGYYANCYSIAETGKHLVDTSFGTILFVEKSM